VTLGSLGSFPQHLAQGRVRVDVARDLSRGQLVALRQGQLGEQFGHFGADHMRPEDFTVFLVGDNFDKAGVFTQTERLAIRLEGEAPHLHLVTGLFGLRFG